MYSQIGDQLISISPADNDPISSFEIYHYDKNYTFTIPTDFAMGSPGQQYSFIVKEGVPHISNQAV